MGVPWNETEGGRPETGIWPPEAHRPPSAPYAAPPSSYTNEPLPPPPSRAAPPSTQTTYPPHGGSPYHRPPGTPPVVGRPWTTGLFDCGQNQTNATLTSFFPCVTFGQIAEMLDEGETSCTLGSFMYILMAPALCTCCLLGSKYRKKLRNKYNLVEAPAEDWNVHLFCPCCSLCQEFRELQNRGIDPSLGWMGYLAQQQEASTEPPKNQFMNM